MGEALAPSSPRVAPSVPSTPFQSSDLVTRLFPGSLSPSVKLENKGERCSELHKIPSFWTCLLPPRS